MPVGYWCPLIAGPSAGSRNQTGVGVAVYDDMGKLVYFKYDYERAIERGDLPESIRDWKMDAPATVEELDKRLDRLANAMSVIRWEGKLPTTVWDEKHNEALYQSCIGMEDS